MRPNEIIREIDNLGLPEKTERGAFKDWVPMRRMGTRSRQSNVVLAA